MIYLNYSNCCNIKAAPNYTENKEVTVFQQEFYLQNKQCSDVAAGYGSPASDFEDDMR